MQDVESPSPKSTSTEGYDLENAERSHPKHMKDMMEIELIPSKDDGGSRNGGTGKRNKLGFRKAMGDSDRDSGMAGAKLGSKKHAEEYEKYESLLVVDRNWDATKYGDPLSPPSTRSA